VNVGAEIDQIRGQIKEIGSLSINLRVEMHKFRTKD
jgi:hypothetical protein